VQTVLLEEQVLHQVENHGRSTCRAAVASHTCEGVKGNALGACVCVLCRSHRGSPVKGFPSRLY
jgi:hypothetical protein